MKPTQKNDTYLNLGFSYLETAEIVVKLNLLLANYQVHFHKLQRFTWNIKGRDFFELHDQFGNMYKTVFNEINQIAERIRVFNQVPVAKLSESLSISELNEQDEIPSGEMMVENVVDDMSVLMSFLIEAYEMSQKNGDVGTTDLLRQLIKRIEKDHWQLNAWLERVEYSPEPQIH